MQEILTSVSHQHLALRNVLPGWRWLALARRLDPPVFRMTRGGRYKLALKIQKNAFMRAIGHLSIEVIDGILV